ncbi:S41 family peptidase [Mucilaginibacter dorajii]|uniref:S41 family peptidase n=2 Tax=Mucilaginibacter dorajii TaxID=692994 RepID=A0ABP7QZE2_9SPHI
MLLHSGLVFCQQLSKADYLEDLQYLKDTLPKRHINLFARISKADFDKNIAAIESRLIEPDYETFTTELFKLTVAIGDEHTHIEPIFTKVIPIRFNKFAEGIYVTATDTTNTDVLLYQLTGINGHAITEVINRFKEIIQSGNPSFFDARLLNFLNNPVILKGLGITGNTEETRFELTAPDGKTIKRAIRSVTGKDAGSLPLVGVKNRQLSPKEHKNYWYAFDPGSGTLYFNYNNCQEQDGHPFSVFNDELLAMIIKSKPQRLVIDLRDNSGGNSTILGPFIERIKRSYLNSKGKLFVLIGRETFSSALMNAIELKRGTYATLVGQPTSGSVNHYGEVRGFRLPHTKIVIGYSTRYWENWQGHNGPLTPDVTIAYSVKNYSKGIDEALVYTDKTW